MFEFKNNDISTILLLVVLGLLIWYLTKSNSTNEMNTTNECFENNPNQVPKLQMMNTPVPSISQMASSVANAVQSSVASAVQASVASVAQASVASVAGAVQSGAGAVQSGAGAVQSGAGAVQSGAGAVQSATNVMQPSVQVNNFMEFDGDYDTSDGADINIAYEAPIPSSNTVISAVDINKSNVQNYDAKDFLPKEINDQWFDTDFSQAKTNVSDDKLINTERYVIGINTVGQSLKNASYDIRGTIANPKFSVSPWNNSTYEPDYNIKPLC